MLEITIQEGPITVTTYQQMRVDCGLSAKTTEAATIGLQNSMYAIQLKDGDRTIGMGRIIGDGGCFCQIVDICVLPEYQGKGLGKIIMQKLIDFINEHLPPSCYVSLIADGDAAFLYEKFGFQPTMPASKGMYLKKTR